MAGRPRLVGRYAIHAQIAAGGIATVHLGRQLGAVGFSRTVAIKRLHPQLAGEPGFVSMFVDEARLATRFRHPNVVPTLDIVATTEDLFLVMEYVHGATLARLMRNAKMAGERPPVPLVAAVLSGVLRGLHAAHEARNERGEPLDMVHRDVSPQNVMVGVDGMARVLDFGIARAVGQLHTTRRGELKGKFGYMAPEQLQGASVTRRSDVYAASVVMWELLAGRRLFHDATEKGIMELVLRGAVEPPSRHAPGLPAELDEIAMRGLSRDPEQRFATASEMANAIESAVPGAIAPTIAAWVERTAAQELEALGRLVAEIERGAVDGPVAPPPALPPKALPPTSPGEVLAGKYRVDGVLGAGAMGKVLAARHLQLDVEVALKVMLPAAMATPEAMARFLREARAAAKLKSEHVARVHDIGALDDGTPYIVMERLEGRDLGAVLAERGPLPIEEAAEYVLQACDALAEAHALGIVHRDLKPANLFVTSRPDGTPVVKVLDFGISKESALSEPASLATSTSALLGSPHYMSPEQLKSARDVDARADVWSLGVILYQLACGQAPFRADSLGQLMARVLTEEPPPLAGLRSDVPAEYAALVASCLDKDVERRCPSVATVACVLATFAPARSRPIADRVVSSLGGDTVANLPSVKVDVTGAVASSPEFGTVAGTVVSRPAFLADATHVMTTRSPAPRTALVLLGGGAVLAGLLVAAVLTAMRLHSPAPAPASPPPGDPSVASPEAAAAPALPALSGEPAASPEPSGTVLVVPEPTMTLAPDAGPATTSGRRPHGPAGVGRPGSPTAPQPSAAHSAGPRYNPLDHL
jgi:serine/threonine-protein kinase